MNIVRDRESVEEKEIEREKQNVTKIATNMQKSILDVLTGYVDMDTDTVTCTYTNDFSKSFSCQSMIIVGISHRSHRVQPKSGFMMPKS